MPNTTTNMSLNKAVDGDNSKTYLETNLGASLDILDTHDHSTNAKGLAVGRLATSVSLSGTTTFTGAGIIINTGGLQVASGDVGIGTAPTTNQGLLVSAGVTASGNLGSEISLNGTVTSAANGDQLYGVQVVPTINIGSRTGVTSVGLFVNPVYQNPSGTTIAGMYVAANSTANATTDKYGLFVGAQTGANLDNYGILVNAPSGASANNHGLNVQSAIGAALIVNANGDVFPGSAAAASALATTAVGGFLFIESCVGVPTGVPTNYAAGRIPLIYDSSNNRIYAYNGAWRQVTLA